MTEQERSTYIELDRLRLQGTMLYYGAMKIRIIGLDVRRDRVFISCEEENGAVHDYDKRVTDLPSFLSRIRLTPTVENQVRIISIAKEKTRAYNAMDYDAVNVWYRHGLARYLVFSPEFSASVFLKKNKKFGFGYREGGSEVYLYPDVNGTMLAKKTSTRLGLWCTDINQHLTAKNYTLELVMVNGKEALKLLPLI